MIDECVRCGEGDVLGKHIHGYDNFVFCAVCQKCINELADNDWSIPE